MANRRRIPKEVEEFVKRRDLSCVYCGISFTNEVVTHKTRPTWEHIINDIRINGPDNIALFEQLINVGAGRPFSISKAHQRKSRNPKQPIHQS